ncbi:MAG: response regulator transcription factor [Gammaproteobacteria bacterium]
MIADATVFIVDDDANVLEGLSMQIEAAGFRIEAFADAENFLAAIRPAVIGCLVLDVRMPGMTGPDLQAELARRNIALPIIFLSGYGDIPLAVKCIQAGAVDFLTKPVSGTLLIERIQTAIRLSAEKWQQENENKILREKIATLTERERQILALVSEGYSNKEIASHLGISFRTVEHHRSRILLRTGSDKLFKLARLYDRNR